MDSGLRIPKRDYFCKLNEDGRDVAVFIAYCI